MSSKFSNWPFFRTKTGKFGIFLSDGKVEISEKSRSSPNIFGGTSTISGSGSGSDTSLVPTLAHGGLLN